MKLIQTNGIQYLEILSKGSSWYCGTDYRVGDLYEAEEVFQEKGTVTPNRVIFVHHPDGRVVEPVILEEGQYFERPAEVDGVIYMLMVDFKAKEIRILDCGGAFEEIKLHVTLPLSVVKDCYNLHLRGTPLMLIRQGGEDTFECIWPEKYAFAMGQNEALVCQDGGKLYFTQWFEDPDYREEVIVREPVTGRILERAEGALFIPPCGDQWVLC